MFSLILYAPKQITHVQTGISEHDRNGAKWEVGHTAIYLTKKGGGGEPRQGVRRGSSKRDGFWKHRSDSVCFRPCVCVCVLKLLCLTWEESYHLIQELLGQYGILLLTHDFFFF